MGLDFNLSPTVSARVIIKSRDNSGWTMGELKRLIAVLELQRAFLAGEPLDVHVRVSTPPPATPDKRTAQISASMSQTDAQRLAEVLQHTPK